ncbi:sine oculis-binding protein homolog A [Trichonephila inaurata madagascariensis]|uniref:Sine oculis-binding protein homolog A n=1 Tax=Trichonephila inaurata madagascariensis TaxID=2747483 RepID=A0A8X6KEH6_9ARAC|nr:sine oculis-binding protein homolog A [Trichonephila inaurata madagascariensis]
MNELLGWYGYEKVDSRDTQGLNLTHFASNNSSATGNTNNPSSNGVSPPSSAIEGSDGSEDATSHNEGLDDPTRLRSDSISPGQDVSSTASDEVARQHQQMVSALPTITKHPGAPDSPNLPPGCIVCAWCQKVGMKLFTLKTPNGCKAFCSELCFTQCRRASFKKNKICDWCKHVRHTVNYVDFQDGEQQLQFCSDKCLNQYKMNIFCKETQAHLQMHTHLKEAACKMAASGSVNLITPELWLRDCKTNGNRLSPQEAIDVIEEINSDGNLSAAPSPSPILESPLPPSPLVVKEKKEHKPEQPHVEKEREKPPKKSSLKHSPKKSSSETKSHHSKTHREKKVNGHSHTNEAAINPRRSPIQASPPAHFRNNQPTNGNHTLLSPPPVGPMPRRHPHIGLPPRHCPPVPSPLGMSNLDHSRQPFLPNNTMPPPFQFLAQQQMEAFFRSQHGLDIRSKLPPPLPLPPWGMPGYPHPPPPPHLPPPPLNSKSPSLPHSSPPSRNHHQNSSSRNNTHHNKHRHNRHVSGHGPSSTAHAKSNPNTEIPLPLTSSLPPVTVMVPFPIILPVPLPIPVPIPIPPDIMEKYSKSKESETHSISFQDKSDKLDNKLDHRKRKNSSEFPKQKKKRKMSVNASTEDCASVQNIGIETIKENAPSEKYFDPVKNISYRISEPPVADLNPPAAVRISRSDPDNESRSYSPLSEAISSNEEEYSEKAIKNNGSVDDFSNINFSNFNLSLVQSSPLLLARATERHLPNETNNDNLENSNSHSPTNLSVKDKHNLMSSNAVNFKKKHLHDQLSLMT